MLEPKIVTDKQCGFDVYYSVDATIAASTGPFTLDEMFIAIQTAYNTSPTHVDGDNTGLSRRRIGSYLYTLSRTVGGAIKEVAEDTYQKR